MPLEELLHRRRVDLIAHGCFDATGADRVDANTFSGDIERGALGQPDDAMLGCMISCASGQSDQTSERGAINDGPAALFLHLDQLMLQKGPDPAQVDCVDSVITFASLLGQRAHRAQNAGVVIGHVEPAKLGNGAFDRRLRKDLV